MRIGINCFLLEAHIGGLKQYFFTLVKELLENDAENEYILFWYEHNRDELAKLDTDRWKEKAILLQNQLDVLSHMDKIDLYFCPFTVLFPRPIPKPTVMTLVDIQERYHPEFFTQEDLFTRQLHFPPSTRMADRVITISEFSKDTLIKHHRLNNNKVVVSYLSADKLYYESTQIANMPTGGLPDNFIFYPANLWQHKNHDRLLQALCILRKEKGLIVPIVLTGFHQNNGYPLEAKLDEYGLTSQAHLLNYVKIEEMIYLYRHASMLVFPSLFEGFGIPLVEAMAVGCPVIASSTSSIPEITSGAALLFDPYSPSSIAEVIEKVWNDQALRKRMIEKGKQRAQNFSANNMAQAHIKAFSEAALSFTYRKYFPNLIYGYYYQLLTEYRWRNYRGIKFLLQKMVSQMEQR